MAILRQSAASPKRHHEQDPRHQRHAGHLRRGCESFAFVVETFERVRKLYRFRRIEMPVFEKTEAFSRAIGETTDVVSKEMYSFEDRAAIPRPCAEFTAGIARAFPTNGWQQHAPEGSATHGPLFRERRRRAGIASSTSWTRKSSARANLRRMWNCWRWPTNC